MNYGFVIDNRNCIGCHACTVACKSEHSVPVGVNRTWVKYIEKGEFPNNKRFFSVMRCNHCENAPCVEICPVTALYTREDGIVDFDNRRCIGCKSCTQACPYDAIYIDPQTHTAAKCNYCSHRVEIGLEPACVNVCPTRTIVSGDMDDPTSAISKLLAKEKVQVRKGEKGTRPKLFYVGGDLSSTSPTASDPTGTYMWSQQTGGVGHFASTNESPQATPFQFPGSKIKSLQVPAHQQSRRVYDPPSKGILWGWEVWTYIVTKAISAGVFLVPFLLEMLGVVTLAPEVRWFSVITALVFLAATNLLLVMDLDRPDRFLYVLLRPQWRSWLVRGAYFMVAYGTLLSLWAGLQFAGQGNLARYLIAPALFISMMVAIYTAFLFAQAKGRDFWQNPLTALHMLNHAILGGSIFMLAFVLTQSQQSEILAKFLRYCMIGGLGVQFLMIAVELWTPHPTEDAHRAATFMIRGHFARPFWAGVLGLGSALPLACLILSGTPAIWLASGGLILFGMLWYCRMWVTAPQQIPLS